MRDLKQRVEELVKDSKYREAARLFAKELNLGYKCNFTKNDKYFEDDTTTRDIYEITLTKDSRNYTFNFGQSIMDSQYYQDRIQDRTYTLSGSPRTGNYKIVNMEKYKLNGAITLVKGEEPDLYDILACLTKHDPRTFEDFCAEFGYDTDSRKAERIYNAVKEEWMNVQVLFNSKELDILREIY